MEVRFSNSCTGCVELFEACFLFIGNIWKGIMVVFHGGKGSV